VTPDQEIQFRKLLSSLTPSTKAFARSLLRNNRYQSLYEDFAQAALLKAWENRDRFTPASNLKGWMFKVIRNAVVSHHRHHRRETLNEDVVRWQPDEISNPERALAVKEAYDRLNRLAEEHRCVLIEYAWHGFAYGEIARRHSVPTGTIKSRIFRARNLLAAMTDLGTTV
jgi:RNA polymerase sigma-70 factor, ECF subfamily